MAREWVKSHKEIHAAISLLLDKDEFVVDSNKIADVLGMDVRTVIGHLKCCQIDNFGMFVDTNNRLFVTKSCVYEMVEKLGMFRKG